MFNAGNTVCLRGTKKVDGRKTGGAALSLPKIRRNPLIEIIAINTGYDYCHPSSIAVMLIFAVCSLNDVKTHALPSGVRVSVFTIFQVQFVLFL